MLAAAALWSTGGVLLRGTHQGFGVEPEALACLRSAAAGLFLAWALPGVRPALGGRFIVAALLYVGLLSTFVIATVRTTAADAIFLQYLYPLLVAVGARLIYRERIGGRGIGALMVGTGGVGLILFGAIDTVRPEGLAIASLSAVCFAGFVLIQRGIRKGSAIGMTSAYNLLTALVLLPIALPHFSFPIRALPLIIFTGIFQIGIPYILFLRGLRRIPATEAAILTLLEPVLNPVWVVLVLAEVPGPLTIAGGTLILGAVVLRLTGPSLLPPRRRPG